MITIEKHFDRYVLRDDLLPGGTKSRFLHQILDPEAKGYVYPSPVYGGFQIALSSYCQDRKAEAVIFCAKRGKPHENTLRCKELGARVLQVRNGYLTVVKARAKSFAEKNQYQYVEFGADYPEAIDSIAQTMRNITEQLGGEPDEIYCAIGSGTLIRGIHKGTDTAKIIGVQVGAEFTEYLSRVEVVKYYRPFQVASRARPPFPSMPNYDRKAYEIMMDRPLNGTTLFWNVL